MDYTPPRIELSYAEREGILNKKLRELTSLGWQVESSTATGASVMFPKIQGSLLLNIFMTLITFGLWLFVWVAAAIFNPFPRDKHARVDVDERGVVHFTRLGLFGPKIAEDHTYAIQAAYQAGEYDKANVVDAQPANRSAVQSPRRVSAPQNTFETARTSSSPASHHSFDVSYEPTEPEEQGRVVAQISFKERLRKDGDTLKLWSGLWTPVLERSLPITDIEHVQITRDNQVVIYGPDGEFVTTGKDSKKHAEKIVAMIRS